MGAALEQTSVEAREVAGEHEIDDLSTSVFDAFLPRRPATDDNVKVAIIRVLTNEFVASVQAKSCPLQGIYGCRLVFGQRSEDSEFPY
jgi:hypothetical protein